METSFFVKCAEDMALSTLFSEAAFLSSFFYDNSVISSLNLRDYSFGTSHSWTTPLKRKRQKPLRLWLTFDYIPTLDLLPPLPL